jgi:hypothetical protein
MILCKRVILILTAAIRAFFFRAPLLKKILNLLKLLLGSYLNRRQIAP